MALLPHLMVLNPVLCKYFKAKQVPSPFQTRPESIAPSRTIHTETQSCTCPIHAPFLEGCRMTKGDPGPQWGAVNSLLCSSPNWLQALSGWGGPRVGDWPQGSQMSQDAGFKSWL